MCQTACIWGRMVIVGARLLIKRSVAHLENLLLMIVSAVLKLGLSDGGYNFRGRGLFFACTEIDIAV